MKKQHLAVIMMTLMCMLAMPAHAQFKGLVKSLGNKAKQKVEQKVEKKLTEVVTDAITGKKDDQTVSEADVATEAAVTEPVVVTETTETAETAVTTETTVPTVTTTTTSTSGVTRVTTVTPVSKTTSSSSAKKSTTSSSSSSKSTTNTDYWAGKRPNLSTSSGTVGDGKGKTFGKVDSDGSIYRDGSFVVKIARDGTIYDRSGKVIGQIDNRGYIYKKKTADNWDKVGEINLSNGSAYKGSSMQGQVNNTIVQSGKTLSATLPSGVNHTHIAYMMFLYDLIR